MLDLTGKVALIIGLGQTAPPNSTSTSTSSTNQEEKEEETWGIGASIALKLSSRGALIFGGNRSLSSASRTKSRIESEGGTCDIFATDATDSASVKALVDACMHRHGRIDILVNNVGRSEPGCPAAMEEGVWDAQMDVNVRSVYLACHFVLPVMESQAQKNGGGGGGCVVNVASVAGLRYIGKPQVAYSAAKAAVMQFTKATAVIYAEKGVRLNTVVPGLIYTPYTRAMAGRYAPGGDEGEYMRARDAQVPMGRMGSAWDVANAVVFLASDEAGYITGQELVVDGGFTSSTGRV
ncbi:hypothetical protein ASPVEDRAFT_43717 [Aspergillus versicolor CBS 583.65]|uniref:Uncharacterized protein n=1 Tax=Aspergillus versicolor CBS 583.65 TaxID=1036611 RepID=A0A1L9PRU0_ASPVE|nr:uncharacterized protein ASPVEDRAFT_43717 [Aspergillus versicolor CBS 583.65]OJJ04254.1 hypothetical protein ASPVEDRAFT_43717 [Aspergillus versicolor CBS 583.65]